MDNFVLVHGGMLGGWCWKKVRACLEQKNHNVLTPTLTGLGERKHLSSANVDLDVHISDVVNTIVYEGWENAILVGHSYGGMVITGVADRIPLKIKRLIYVDALVPKNGESMFDIVDSHIVLHLKSSAQERQGVWEVLPASPQAYGLDTDVHAEWFATHCTPHPLKSFEQAIRLNDHSVETIERIYIKCLRDSALESMLVRAKALGIPCYLMDSGHFPMITHPQKLAELLLL
jgi:pimeloyl-ACP methyl ester carboxylesterase